MARKWREERAPLTDTVFYFIIPIYLITKLITERHEMVRF